jgi:hypothetical protein
MRVPDTFDAPTDPPPLLNGDLQCGQTGGRDPHHHFQVPAVRLFLQANLAGWGETATGR